MKNYLILFSVLFCLIASGQSSKKYKTVIVPVQYGFTSEPNQFQLNVLTRVMLKEEGFEVYMSEGETIPSDIANNPCASLKADVKKDSGLFASNLRFQLFNCYGNLVYESTGSSREKAYRDAYKAALKEAITKFQMESYKYVDLRLGNEKQTTVEVEQLEETPKSFEDLATVYDFEGKPFWMVKQDKDYVIYEDMGETVWATLKYADKGTYSYDSELIDGAAYFTPEGNLIVEYLAKDKDAVQELVFKKQ